MRFVLLALPILLPVAFASADEERPLQFGVVVSDEPGTACIAGDGLRLLPGDSMTVVIPETLAAIGARVLRRVDDCDAWNQGVFGDSVRSYAMALDADSDWWPALGVSRPGVTADLVDGRLGFSVPGVPGAFLLTGCTSSEGYHLIVRRGSDVVWHQYYYVPYSTVPDCTEEDFVGVEVR